MRESPIDKVLARLDKVRASGREQWRAQCPGHGGKGLNLSIGEAADGTVLLTCHSRGCSFDEIVAGLGLEPSDPFPQPLNGQPRRPPRIPARRRKELEDDDEQERMVLRYIAIIAERGELTYEHLERVAQAWDTRRAIAEELQGGVQ